MDDFSSAIRQIRPSVSPADIAQYLEWDKMYGSGG